MSANKKTVEAYMAAYRVHDHAGVLGTLTDDVEWVLPGAFHKKGKAAFDAEIENDCFEGRPDIRCHRMTEEGDVVICEGKVKTKPKGQPELWMAFVDVFEFRGGRIAKLTSYLMPLPGETG